MSCSLPLSLTNFSSYDPTVCHSNNRVGSKDWLTAPTLLYAHTTQLTTHLLTGRSCPLGSFETLTLSAYSILVAEKKGQQLYVAALPKFYSLTNSYRSASVSITADKPLSTNASLSGINSSGFPVLTPALPL